MQDTNLCKICGKRRAKRHCPAVEGDICPICCGTERETSLFCPLECEHLQQAHEHEDPLEIDPATLIAPDVEVDEQFLVHHEELLLFLIYALLQAAIRTPRSVDTDVLDALAALVKTYQTRESGLVYQTVPDNPVAATIARAFTVSLDDYSKIRGQREPLQTLKDSDVLTALVFLHRLGVQNLNGRPKGRMYMELLRNMTPDTPIPQDDEGPRLII